MKLRTIVKIAVTSSVVLLCTGFVMYYFFKLSAAADRRDFNLYTVVPSSAVTVFETDNVADFVQDINELSVSKADHFLYASQLFSYLKQHLSTLLDDTPHGLSRQMNKVLISFHEPDNDHNQVLYCCLGEGDKKKVEEFIRKYISPEFPAKVFRYKDEDILIYPTSDGEFLACYLTDDFLALSYQKKLIEEVIDARGSRHSLAMDSSFLEVCDSGKSGAVANFYLRLPALEGKSMLDAENSGGSVASGWTALEMKMNGDAIYFSGIVHGGDSCFTSMSALCKQQPVQGFPGEILPSSTFFFSKRSASDLASLLCLAKEESEGSSPTGSGNSISRCDEELARYLQENGASEVVTCLFLAEMQDSLASPVAVVSIPVVDVPLAERALQKLVEGAWREDGGERTLRSRPRFCYTPSRAYLVYSLPCSALFLQLSEVSDSLFHTAAAFYGDRLLLASEAEGLCRYIRFLEAGEVLEGTAAYEEGKNTLADSYNFMLMADFADIFRQPERYVRTVPEFFFRHQDFFRHFILSAQFVCTDGVVYPNLVLLYKGG